MIADRYSARTLMSLSLFATALGGFYLYTLPSATGLFLLFAYWGITSILLFWAALIKATRDWAGAPSQGLAFGLLDGGRGLVASLFATGAVFILSARIKSGSGDPAALQSVILFYSVVTLLSAAVVWRALPRQHAQVTEKPNTAQPNWRSVFRLPAVWLQAGVVICAYCGYKALDNYGVYAVQVLDMSQLEAASLNTYASYTRPIAAISAGIWADRWRSSKLVALLFASAGLAFFLLGQDFAASATSSLLLANLLITFIAVYALRGIYFSLIEEAHLDRAFTGRAVGLISVLGFTPDIFFAAITGRVLDANPGATGFQHYFLLLAGICAAGMLFTGMLSQLIARSRSAA